MDRNTLRISIGYTVVLTPALVLIHLNDAWQYVWTQLIAVVVYAMLFAAWIWRPWCKLNRSKH